MLADLEAAPLLAFDVLITSECEHFGGVRPIQQEERVLILRSQGVGDALGQGQATQTESCRVAA